VPVRNYGVLKGRVVGRVMERDSDSPHFQIHLKAGGVDYRAAVNIRSYDHQRPELLFYVAENFQHVVTTPLPTLPEGFHRLRSRSGGHGTDNGVYQDGAILLHFPDSGRWVGIFLAFQSQRWHSYDRPLTDQLSGDPVTAIAHPGPANAPGADEPDYDVRIIAAMINPPGGDTGRETVTLLNATSVPVDLKGWKLLDMQKRGTALNGVLPPGGTRIVKVSHRMHLSNNGGIITLVNPRELKVHGVSYTQAQAHEEGKTTVFQ
jgi:hypothetical protein